MISLDIMKSSEVRKAGDRSTCKSSTTTQHNLRVERSSAIHDTKAPVILTTLSPKRLTSKLTIGPDR